MQDIISTIFSKDPLIVISFVIAIISFIFIVILSYYYKRLKEEQLISEVISSTEKLADVPSKKKDKTVSEKLLPETPEKKSMVLSDIDLVIAQLNELSTQVNSLNNYVKELTNIVKSLQQKQTQDLTEQEMPTFSKLVNVLQDIQSYLTSLQQSTRDSFSTISEVNKKLDNLINLLSSILQQ